MTIDIHARVSRSSTVLSMILWVESCTQRSHSHLKSAGVGRGRRGMVLRKQNKMSENAHESKVEMVISTVPKPVFKSVFWTFYSASVIYTRIVPVITIRQIFFAGECFVFLGGIKITVIFILLSKTRMCRKFFFRAVV